MSFSLNAQTPSDNFGEENFLLDFERSVPGYNNQSYLGKGFDVLPSSGQLNSSNLEIYSGGQMGLNRAENQNSPKASGGYQDGNNPQTEGYYSFEYLPGEHSLGIVQSYDNSSDETIILFYFRHDLQAPVENYYFSADIWYYNDRKSSTAMELSFLDLQIYDQVLWEGITPHAPTDDTQWEKITVGPIKLAFPILGGIDHILQFSLDARLGGPNHYSDKVLIDNIRFTYGGVDEPQPSGIYRQLQTGRWTDTSTWEVQVPPSTDYVPASEFPTAENSDSVVVLDTVFLDAPVNTDGLTIARGGILELSAQLTLIDNEGVELDLQGKLLDYTRAGNEVVFEDGATWQMRDTSIYIKFSDSDGLVLRDHYEGGVQTVPSDAVWVYRYEAPETGRIGIVPRVISEEIVYPTLIFDNTDLNTYDTEILNAWDSRRADEPSEKPEWSLTGPPPTVKGDMVVSGWKIYLNCEPTGIPKVQGGFFLDTEGEITNAPQTIVDNTGLGLEVWQNLRIDGKMDLTSTDSSQTFQGALVLGGFSGQRVYGAIDTVRVRSIVLDSMMASDTISLPTIVKDTVILGDYNLVLDGTELIYDTTSLVFPPLETKQVAGYIQLDFGSTVTRKFKQNLDFETFTFNLGKAQHNPVTITKNGNSNAHLRVSILDDVLEGGGSGFPIIRGVVPLRWHIERINSNIKDALFTIDAFWNGGQELPDFDLSESTLARWNGSQWEGGVVRDVSNDSPPYWSRNEGLQDGDFGYFAVFSQEALMPIELEYFSVATKNEKVVLNWKTSTETENDFFEIQRAVENLHFTILGILPGQGTTSEPQFYEYVDDDPLPGINYYRFRQVDLDGSFSFSPIESVQMGQPTYGWKLGPNPTSGPLNLVWDHPIASSTVIILSNSLGQEVRRQKITSGSGQANIKLPSHLPSGAYYIQWSDEKGRNTRQIIKK